MKVIKTWPKLNSIRDIQVFIDFVNFYYYFIKGFTKIIISLTLILKTILLTTLPTSSFLENVNPTVSEVRGIGDTDKTKTKNI